MQKKLEVGSDLLSYHLRELLKSDLIVKKEDSYSLSVKGVDTAGRMDTFTRKMEKQPKVSVVLIVKKVEAGVEKYLIQKRLKQPYFGYLGFLTGKVTYGETILETADREAQEEAGISAKFEHKYVLYELVYDQNKNILEDKFFNVMYGEYTNGEIVNGEGAENIWCDMATFYSLTPKYHNEDEIFEWYKNGQKEFVEKKYIVNSF